MKRKLPLEEPRNIVVNVPTNGNGHGHVDEERISESDLIILKSLRTEIDSLRQRQNALQKELTLASADIYRKQDELERKALEVSKKYNLLKGKRELEMSTGRIVKFGEK